MHDEIKSQFASNIVQDCEFSDLLNAVIRRYQSRSIGTAPVIEALIAVAKKGAGRHLACAEALLKRARSEYPPDKQDTAVQLVLEQALTLREEWSV